jgi:hypothetical protein
VRRDAGVQCDLSKGGDSVLNADMLTEALIWAALAALAWNFKGMVTRFPYFFLSLQSTRLAMPTVYARVMLAVFASWEIALNAGVDGNPLPPACFVALAAVWLYIGWHHEGEEHLHWLGAFACGTAVVLCWQSLTV